jgi:Ca2+/H+ antiporter
VYSVGVQPARERGHGVRFSGHAASDSNSDSCSGSARTVGAFSDFRRRGGDDAEGDVEQEGMCDNTSIGGGITRTMFRDGNMDGILRMDRDRDRDRDMDRVRGEESEVRLQRSPSLDDGATKGVGSGIANSSSKLTKRDRAVAAAVYTAASAATTVDFTVDTTVMHAYASHDPYNSDGAHSNNSGNSTLTGNILPLEIDEEYDSATLKLKMSRKKNFLRRCWGCLWSFNGICGNCTGTGNSSSSIVCATRCSKERSADTVGGSYECVSSSSSAGENDIERGSVGAGIAGSAPSSSSSSSKHVVEEVLSFYHALLWLAILTVLITLLSDNISYSIEQAAEDVNMSGVFLGAIVLPIVGNAAEHASAITFAMRNKMDVALGVAVGSSTQIALLVLPLLVLVGWSAKLDMSLNFGAFESSTLVLSVIGVTFAIKDGTSNWLLGVVMIASYIIVSIGFYTHENSSLK